MSDAAAAPIRIDAHAHVFLRDLPLTPDHRHAPPRDARLSEFLAILDAHGMTHAVLTAPSFYGTDNSFLLSALRAEPTRLRGTVIIDPTIGLDRLEGMNRLGVVGIRLNLLRRKDLPDLRSVQWQRAIEAIGSLGWHVEIYVEGPRLCELLPPLLDARIDVVIDHFGSPDPTLGLRCPGFRLLLDALQTGRVWVKLSAPYRLGGADPRPYADALLRAGGPERLVWASDWPWTQNDAGMTYERTLRWLDTWVPDAGQRAQILGPTAWSLFRFEQPSATRATQGRNDR